MLLLVCHGTHTRLATLCIVQDVLGTRKKCEATCKEALAAGRNVVIDRCVIALTDSRSVAFCTHALIMQSSLQLAPPSLLLVAWCRCNFNAQQRAVWVQLARTAGATNVRIIALQLVVPPSVCKERVRLQRQAAGRPAQADRQGGEDIVDRWADYPSACHACG